ARFSPVLSIVSGIKRPCLPAPVLCGHPRLAWLPGQPFALGAVGCQIQPLFVPHRPSRKECGCLRAATCSRTCSAWKQTGLFPNLFPLRSREQVGTGCFWLFPE